MSWPDSDALAAALEHDAPRQATSLTRLRLLKAGPHPSTTGLVQLAARTVQASYAALVLVDGRLARVQAATHRLPPAFPVETCLAALAITSDTDVAVFEPDDERRHPAGLRLALEAAAVVRSPDGVPVGALEVGWLEPRDLDDTVRDALHDLAGLAEEVLELRAEAEEYRRFVELTPDPVLILDLVGDVRQVNPALLGMLGIDDGEQVIGRSFVGLFARPDRARIAAALGRVPFSRVTVHRLDTRLVRPDGEQLPCSLSMGLLGGTRRHLQVTIHDLSDRLRDEEARTQLSEQLARAQRLDAVGQVAGGLAHDLNNLLVVMSANLSMAHESLGDLEVAGDREAMAPLLEDLDEVRAAVDRASDMTRQLLQFARREQGKAGVADLATVVGAIQQLLSRSLKPAVRLEVDLAPDLAPVAADPVQLERAVLNLVNNAVDAVGEAGTIRIRASTDTGGFGGKERRSDLAAKADRVAVRLEVVDDGGGMDEVTRVRACEPLFTTKPEGRGTGLGLSAVLAFADEVDATLSLSSAPGQGTTASLVVPVHEPGGHGVPVGLDRPVAGARVVLVDPGERTRRVIARMLGEAGYRVTTCASGEDALELLATNGTDLLVTELVLPATSGIRLIGDARQLLPGLPVVVLAAVEAPRALEGDPVLVKPFSQTRLLRTVERVLGQR